MQSKQNNKDYIVGMYVRLSRDDEHTTGRKSNSKFVKNAVHSNEPRFNEN